MNQNYRQNRFAELTKQNLERDGVSLDSLVHRQIDREIEQFNDIWVDCDRCHYQAQFFESHVGCYNCGGLECGDSSTVRFYCPYHAEIFECTNLIPLCCDPIEYCYALLADEQKRIWSDT